jgi:uncharacterized protein YndB with AHSA1/START domain
MPVSNAGNRATSAAEREVVISRVFNAPRELVFAAWTDPKQVVQWWGPRGFTTTTHEMDVRPGGVWRFTMHGPDGTDYENKIRYVEVERPERIAYTHMGDNDGPVHFEAIITFEDQGGKTKTTMRMIFTTGEERARVAIKCGAVEGLKQHIDRLGEYVAGQRRVGEAGAFTVLLPTEREIVLMRVFNAPRELVWKVISAPEHVPNWWGRTNYATRVDKLDMRPGGKWRFVQHTPNGHEYGFNGEYREIVPPERMVFTFEFEGLPGHVLLQTVTLEEIDGKTKLTSTALFENSEDRDGMLHSGMEVGAAESYDRLEQLIETMAKA